MNTKPERAAFEALFSECGNWPDAVRRSGDGYMLASTQSAWNAYKAAWGCQQSEIDRLRAELLRVQAYIDETPELFDAFVPINNMA